MPLDHILFSRPTPRKNIKNVENPPLPSTEVFDDGKMFSGSFPNYLATGIVMVLRAGRRATGSASILTGPVGTLYARTHARTATVFIQRPWPGIGVTRKLPVGRGNVAGRMDRGRGNGKQAKQVKVHIVINRLY